MDNSTLKRKLSSSAPELQTVSRKQNGFMVIADIASTTTRVLGVDDGLDESLDGCAIGDEGKDLNEITTGNTMETDDSSSMNQYRQPKGQPHLGDTYSTGYKNLNLRRLASESAAITTKTSATTASGQVNLVGKTKTTGNKVDRNHGITKNSSHNFQLTKGLIRRQARFINSIMAIKMKTLFLLINLLPSITWLCPLPVVQAGFWTFYLPNFLKPSGYNELTGMIEKVEASMNETRDAFADIQYFWGIMNKMDDLDESSLYPEESACVDVFPLFRKLAIEYTYIDYEHFMKPMESYYNLLRERRDEWFPEGPKSKTILPRVWEQNLFESDLTMKMFWLSKLTNDPDYRNKREQMVNIWKSVKRNLDSSLPCIYLKYSYRQMAEDINQLALDSNLERMKEAESMINAAYKRIDKFSDSDEKAKKDIADAIKKEERFNI